MPASPPAPLAPFACGLWQVFLAHWCPPGCESHLVAVKEFQGANLDANVSVLRRLTQVG